MFNTRRATELVTRATALMFGLVPILLLPFFTIVWKASTGDDAITAAYWVVQTMVTVGYGYGFSNSWHDAEKLLCIDWMLTGVCYWTILLAKITDHLKTSR